MPINFDTAFGISQYTIKLRAQRAEVLASNLVNADTPNYKARDYDFDAALQRANSEGPGSLKATNKGHITPTSNGYSAGELLYRTPLQASLDGNTVNSQLEQTEFSRNAAQYQASLRFLDGKIKGLMTAIKGE